MVLFIYLFIIYFLLQCYSFITIFLCDVLRSFISLVPSCDTFMCQFYNVVCDWLSLVSVGDICCCCYCISLKLNHLFIPIFISIIYQQLLSLYIGIEMLASIFFFSFFLLQNIFVAMAVEFIVMIFTSDQTICSKPCIFKRLYVN